MNYYFVQRIKENIRYIYFLVMNIAGNGLLTVAFPVKKSER